MAPYRTLVSTPPPHWVRMTGTVAKLARNNSDPCGVFETEGPVHVLV